MEATGKGRRDRPVDEEEAERDYEIAEEIARFIANRAFLLEARESRAWALTDFRVWANLADCEPQLSLVPRSSRDRGVD